VKPLEKEDFRDRIATANEEGKRAWVYPKKPEGWFYKQRTRLTYLLLILLIASPFIHINGNQFMMFNFLEREFTIFGLPFWPQDFYIGVTAMIIAVIFVTLFTVVIWPYILRLDLPANHFYGNGIQEN
jgi:hypothetical protein